MQGLGFKYPGVCEDDEKPVEQKPVSPVKPLKATVLHVSNSGNSKTNGKSVITCQVMNVTLDVGLDVGKIVENTDP